MGGTYGNLRASLSPVRIIYSRELQSWTAIYEMISGWLERTVELAGGKNPRIDFKARSWAGDPTTIYRISWQAE
jgi:hypothetical protein